MPPKSRYISKANGKFVTFLGLSNDGKYYRYKYDDCDWIYCAFTRFWDTFFQPA